MRRAGWSWVNPNPTPNPKWTKKTNPTPNTNTNPKLNRKYRTPQKSLGLLPNLVRRAFHLLSELQYFPPWVGTLSPTSTNPIQGTLKNPQHFLKKVGKSPYYWDSGRWRATLEMLLMCMPLSLLSLLLLLSSSLSSSSSSYLSLSLYYHYYYAIIKIISMCILLYALSECTCCISWQVTGDSLRASI